MPALTRAASRVSDGGTVDVGLPRGGKQAPETDPANPSNCPLREDPSAVMPLPHRILEGSDVIGILNEIAR